MAPELPLETWINVIEVGEFSRRRLLALQRVHPIFAELVAPKLLHTITIPFTAFAAQHYPTRLARRQGPRVEELTTDPRLARLRKCVKRVRILAASSKIESFASFSEQTLKNLGLALQKLADIDLTLSTDRGIFRVPQARAALVASMLKLLCGPNRAFHLDYRGVYIWEFNRFAMELLVELCSGPTSRPLDLPRARRWGISCSEPAPTTPPPVVIRSFRMWHASRVESRDVVEFLEQRNSADALSNLTALDVSGNAGLDVETLRKLPALRDYSVTDYEPDSVAWTWSYFEEIRLRSMRVTMAFPPVCEYISSPQGSGLEVLDLDLAITLVQPNSETEPLREDQSARAEPFWTACASVRETLVQLFVAPHRNRLWMLTRSRKYRQLLDQAAVWQKSAHEGIVFPKLQFFSGVLVYDREGCFDTLMRSISLCPRIEMIRLVVFADNTKRQKRPGLDPLDRLFTELENSREANGRLNLDTELEIEIVTLPYAGARKHCTREYILSEEGWHPLCAPLMASYHDRKWARTHR